ncbi:MAG: transcriptional repressor [Clostridia bacterium]|nr:transcriptional repressor [Clostridia bacterium]
MEYKTKHKKTIEDIFNSHKGECFNAEQITNLLKEEGSSVSIATVYRHLDFLVKSGKIAKIPTQTGSFLYQSEKCDSCSMQHCSLMCVNCGKIIHMDCDELSKLSSHVEEEHGFYIDHFKTVIYGQCIECKKNAL